MTAISKICNLILWAAAAAVLSASCVRDEEGIDCARMPEVTLRLSTVAANTRDVSDDVKEPDEYAQNPEESISRVDLFFYTSAESTDAAPLYVYETTLNATTKTDLTVKIPIELKQQFPDNKGYVYALVNLPAAVTVDTSNKSVDGASATLENLQKVWVEENAFVGKDAPANFVMRGGGVITLQQGAGGATSASGTVLLERLASKIRLWASLPEVVYVDENGRTIVGDESDADWQERIKDAEKWVPIPSGNKMDGSGSDEYEQMKLYIYNVATTGRIDATTTETERLKYGNVERESGNKINEKARKLVKGDDLELPAADISKDFPYSHTTAYYSYPNVWDSTSPEEEHQTYVIVSLLWGRVGADNSIELYQPCYYQVPVNALKQSDTDAERDCLEPNKYYRIKVNISMLGSKDLGDPLPVNASWEVVDWVPAEVDVNIKARRYLVVNEKEWVMNNASTIEIPFSTSHETVVEECYVTYFRYYEPWGLDVDSRIPASTNGTYGITSSWEQTSTGWWLTDWWFGTSDALTHQMQEYVYWLRAARDQLQGGVTGEGLITANFDDKTGDILYYKQNYFYDEVYASLRVDDGTGFGIGYKYYVGHEQPKTFKVPKDFSRVSNTNESKINYGNVPTNNAAARAAWKTYRDKYGIDAVYTCTVDDKKGVLRFSHPLVQWNEVRNGNNGTGAIQYYTPETNAAGNLRDEFSRCEIVIKIKHKDWNDNDDLYKETIHITQYPAMYVEVSHNYGYVCKFDSSRNVTQGNEYVRVNGNKIEEVGANTGSYPSYVTEWFETGRWVEYVGSINNNPNMYVIHTTQLSEDNEVLYDIGDPRALYRNNILTNESMGKDSGDARWDNSDCTPKSTKSPQNKENSKGPAWYQSRNFSGSYTYSNYVLSTSLYPEYKPENSAANPPTSSNNWNYVNNKNNLCFYYPTDESSSSSGNNKENFIAPSFRIASSFGKVTLDTSKGPDDAKMQARRRCAAYQEAGRPAGRWRLPTMAEVKYVVQLSNELKIPVLFGFALGTGETERTATYWTATGVIGVKVTVDKNTQHHNGEIVGNQTTAQAVRCVYDDWYWTQIDGTEYPTDNGVLETDFYWGDRPKDNTQSKSIMQKAINKKPIQAVKAIKNE